MHRPQTPSALDLIAQAVSLHRAGHSEDALACLTQATASFPNDARLFVQRAAIHSQLGQLGTAMDDYRAAIALAPRHLTSLNNLAVLLAQQGQHSEAVSVYEAALEAHPQVGYLHSNLGLSLKTLGRNRCAALALEQGMSWGDDKIELRMDCAHAWSKAKEPERALVHYDVVLSRQADNVRAHHNRGAALLELGRVEEAMDAEQRALALQPDYVWANLGLGNALNAAQRYEEAVVAFDQALVLDPRLAATHNNRANALRALKRDADALAAYERACELQPQEEAYVKGLASMFSERGQHTQAQAVLERALQDMPSNAGLHFALGLSLLASAQWTWGWFHFEWRYGTPEGFARPYKSALPSWRPELPAKRVLVSSEWGLGDQIMFASMLNDLARWPIDVTVMVDPRLLRLFGAAFPHVQCVSRGEKVGDHGFDAHVSMSSLGQFTRLQSADFEAAAQGFLRADERHATALRATLLGVNRRLVGISWRTGRDGAGHRNIDLATLVSALHGPGVVLVSLQYGEVTDDIQSALAATGIPVLQCDSVDNKQDIDGLAALIRACDAVVSVDNTTVHLAGALGASTYALLPHPSDWRWMHDGERSPWYDSVHLCRQQHSGDWSGALTALARSLPR